ncbi:MAG: hypothetical protein Q8L64_03220 [bacterium]|nr:hypothetical protein [bacterium]
MHKIGVQTFELFQIILTISYRKACPACASAAGTGEFIEGFILRAANGLPKYAQCEHCGT